MIIIIIKADTQTCLVKNRRIGTLKIFTPTFPRQMVLFWFLFLTLHGTFIFQRQMIFVDDNLLYKSSLLRSVFFALLRNA